MQTIGLSPKMVAAVIGAILGYLATQQILDLPAWADLLVQVGLVAVAAWAAGPGTVTVEAYDINAELRDRGERGQGLLEALLIVFVVVVIVAVLFGWR